MNWLQIVILGIVQGITEFLPVSSSGHLVVVQALFGGDNLEGAVEVNILLHAGTLAAILTFYWRRIIKLLTSDRRVIGLLIVGTVPIVLVGMPMMKYGSDLLGSPLLSGCMFVVTGVLLIWSSKAAQGEIEYENLSYQRAILIGLFQAAAVLPGLSRSGSTIAAGLLLGMRREAAATFSFLLAIPAIGGATLVQCIKLYQGESGSTSAGILLLGALVAYVVGLASLWGLIRLVQRGHLAWFAWWLLPLGLMVIIWQLTA